MNKSMVSGLYVPLVTPMLAGEFDGVSMAKLIKSVDVYVDGFVPCLSSGEGQLVSNELWTQVVECVRAQTDKPVFPGIKRENMADTKLLAKRAQELGCAGITVPVPSSDWSVTKAYFADLLAEVQLPVMVYNTETAFVADLEQLKELDQYEQIVAIKDSSMNREFFAAMCRGRENGELAMSVLQGMEHQLDVPAGCDGYLVSLLNVEPQLVREMWENKSRTAHREVIRKFVEYNLGADWFITLKALLYGRGVIRSAEQVKQFIDIGDEWRRELRLEGQVEKGNVSRL